MERIVVLSRIADLLGSATGALSRGEYGVALDALEQARVLDPENGEIVVFEERLRSAHRDMIAAHLPVDSGAAAPAHSSEVAGMLESAREAAARGDFREALRSVTTAAILEPGSPEVTRCEQEIRSIQESFRREDDNRKAEALRLREEAGRDREEIADAEQERRHTAAQIARHVAAARDLLEAGEFGHALVEIDHAFLLNPLDVEVRTLQREIVDAQDRAAGAPDGEGRSQAALIAGHLADAVRLRARGKPDEALQAIGRVLLLEPSSESALSFERQLQAEIAATAPLKSPPVPAAHTADPRSASVRTPAADRPRRNRRATYLLAASFLATAVLVLVSLTQMLSRADNQNFIPEPSPAAGTPGGASSPEDTGATDSTSQVREPLATEAEASRTSGAAARADGQIPQEVLPGVLHLEQPDLPEQAAGAEATERVTVRVLVDSTGRALLSAVVKSTNPALDQPVINAVMRSSYTPWSGQPVSRWITIPLTFTR
jgi:TonB family protein